MSRWLGVGSGLANVPWNARPMSKGSVTSAWACISSRPSPETTKRSAQERTIQLALGRALLATKGYAAPGSRSRLHQGHGNCVSRGRAPSFSPCSASGNFYVLRGDFAGLARELKEQLLALAQYFRPAYLLGPTGRWRSPASRWARCPPPGHAERGIGLYHPQ